MYFNFQLEIQIHEFKIYLGETFDDLLIRMIFKLNIN